MTAARPLDRRGPFGIDKPPHGAACNSCGLCCQEELCVLAALTFGERGGPCPALERDGDSGRSACGLVRNPQVYAPAVVAREGRWQASNAAAMLIGKGLGCDGQLDGEPADEAWRRRTFAKAKRNRMTACLWIWRPA